MSHRVPPTPPTCDISRPGTDGAKFDAITVDRPPWGDAGYGETVFSMSGYHKCRGSKRSGTWNCDMEMTPMAQDDDYACPSSCPAAYDATAPVWAAAPSDWTAAAAGVTLRYFDSFEGSVWGESHLRRRSSSSSSSSSSSRRLLASCGRSQCVWRGARARGSAWREGLASVRTTESRGRHPTEHCEAR